MICNQFVGKTAQSARGISHFVIFIAIVIVGVLFIISVLFIVTVIAIVIAIVSVLFIVIAIVIVTALSNCQLEWYRASIDKKAIGEAW